MSLNLPGLYPPLKVRGIVVSGMDAPHLEPPCRAPPSLPRGSAPRPPATAWATSGSGARNRSKRSTNNARLTAESFRGRAEGGWLADRIVPDWSVLLVQFQNLDPFQHRVWPYLNVDETGVERPDWNNAGGRGDPGPRSKRSGGSASWPRTRGAA